MTYMIIDHITYEHMITDHVIICLFIMARGGAINQHPPSAKRRLQRRAGRTLSPTQTE